MNNPFVLFVNSMRKTVFVGIVVILVLFIIAWFLILFRILSPSVSMDSVEVNNSVVDSIKDTQEKELDVEDNTDVKPTVQTKVFNGFSDSDIRKGQVIWQDPKDLGDLGWTIPEIYKGIYQYSNDQNGQFYTIQPIEGIRYVKVGNVIDGKYKGADILVVLVWIMDGPGSNTPNLYHFLQKNGDTVLLQYADVQDSVDVNDINGPYFFKKSAIFDNQYLFKEGGINTSKMPRFTFDENTRIEDLVSFPDQFVGRSDAEVFVRDMYRSRGFFSEKGLKEVFLHNDFGKVWISGKDVSQKYPFNSYTEKVIDFSKKYKPNEDYEYIFQSAYFEPLSVGGVYIKRPDGIIQVYKLKTNILDESNHFLATWDDGLSNTGSYSDEPDGCGYQVYINDVSGYIDVKKDLKPVGKTLNGEILYGLKNTHQKIFKQVYKEAVDSYSSDKDRQPFSNESEFLALKPLIYWTDSLGRLIEFHNTNAIQPIGGCGKPVVYLYPEKTTEVSVKVFPSQGVSVSDPDYDDGWNVIAQSDGTITNKTDNRNYPYLFWEGGSDAIYQIPKQGFVSSNTDLETFFNEKLDQLGLSFKEASDFKEFWIPKMRELNKPYYFVTFLSRDQIDNIAPLKVDPQPDTVIRIMMDYEGLDSWKPVQEYVIQKPKRSGFTVVEWGGRLK